MTAGFGLEKLGLVSLRYPWLCLVASALVTPFLAYGANQLQFSMNIRETFRSGDPACDQLDLVDERFPDVQRDMHVVVSSDKLKELQALKTLQEELGRVRRPAISFRGARDSDNRSNFYCAAKLNAVARSATNIPSICRIANIALNDAMILPYGANASRMEFSEETG